MGTNFWGLGGSGGGDRRGLGAAYCLKRAAVLETLFLCLPAHFNQPSLKVTGDLVRKS
jgi:hypothetical protein